jgi:hypothetical protein
MGILFRNIIIFSFLCILISCKKDKEAANESLIENQEAIALPKLPERIKLSPKARLIVNNWTEFREFEAGIERLYGSGDDITEAEALVKLEAIFSESTIPKEYNISPILARFLVLKTFLEQLEAAAQENIPDEILQGYKIKVIESYNSLLIQFNDALNKSVAEDFLKEG